MDTEKKDSEGSICRDEKKLLQIFQEMEEKDENRREISGAIVGPFFSRAIFHCTVRMGFEDEAK